MHETTAPGRAAEHEDADAALAADLAVVARQLGRAPRGVLAIAYRCPDGAPAVVRTAPRLPDGTPFPTLYYLTEPRLTAAVGRLESVGVMRAMSERLQADAALAAAYRAAHEDYLVERDGIEDLGTDFSGGGMPERVKCLHVLVAHSLARGPGCNPLGDEAVAMLADGGISGVGLRGAAVPAEWPRLDQLPFAPEGGERGEVAGTGREGAGAGSESAGARDRGRDDERDEGVDL